MSQPTPEFYQAPDYGPYGVAAPPSKGLSIAAFVVGIVSFLIGWFPWLGLVISTIGIVLGIAGLRSKQAPALATLGLVFSGLAALASIGWGLLVLFSPR